MDFEIMNKALKIAWIKRITEHVHSAWKIIPEFAAAKYGGLSFLTECQYDIKYLSLDNLPPFYHTLLKYWQEYNANKFLEDHCIHNKIVWNNSRILIGDQPVFFKPFFEAQVTRIKQFLKEDNTFFSLDELILKVDINIPFTLYYGLIAAIPTEWKTMLSQNNFHQNAPLEDLPSTRIAYATLLSNNVSPQSSENRILNYGFSKESIQKVYSLPFLITKDSKLIAFQFKIIHHILPTKSSLFRVGITESDICSLCAIEKQTLNHLLYHCTVSKAFWNRFTSWWYQKFNQVLFLTESNILYGWHNNIKNKQALNVTLLIAKFHIFATSSRDGNLCFEGFLLRLQDKLDNYI